MPRKNVAVKTWESKFIEMLSGIADRYGLEIVTAVGRCEKKSGLTTTIIQFQPIGILVSIATVKLSMVDDAVSVAFEPNIQTDCMRGFDYEVVPITCNQVFASVFLDIGEQLKEFVASVKASSTDTESKELLSPSTNMELLRRKVSERRLSVSQQN